MMATADDIFDPRPSGTFRIGTERPFGHYNALKIKSNYTVLIENARRLDLAIIVQPSFIKNMFLKTSDFVKATRRKPRLIQLVPAPSTPAPKAKGSKGSRALGSFGKAMRSAFPWVASPMPDTPAHLRPGYGGELLKKDKELLELEC